MKKIILISVVLVMVLTGPIAQAQTDERWANGVSESWWFGSTVYTEAEAALARSKWEQVGEEIKGTQGNEWVGTYVASTGELHTSYLRWSPQLGFVSMGIYTCEGRATNLNYGGVTFSPTLLRLLPEVPIRNAKSHGGHGSHGPQFIPDTYLPVIWGGQHYLVPEKSVAAFYSYISGIGESGEGFFLKLDDYGKPVKGMPVLPPGYERFVRKPIHAEVIHVGAKRVRKHRAYDRTIYYDSVTPVTLDAGRANGIKSGMSLYIVGSKIIEKVEIVRVGKNSSRGIITRSLGDDMKDTYKDRDTGERRAYPEISVGLRVTTSWHLKGR